MQPTKGFIWRNSDELHQVRAKLITAVRVAKTKVWIDIKTAHELVEALDQAIHTEQGHEPPP